MPSQRVRDITAPLPYSLRESVNGYVDAVAAAIPEIEREAGVEITSERRDEYLIIVAMRRIWASVSNQYWIMSDCISLAVESSAVHPTGDEQHLRGFRAGRDEFRADSAAFVEGRQLFDDFQELIAKLEVEDLVSRSRSLADLAERMFSSPQ